MRGPPAERVKVGNGILSESNQADWLVSSRPPCGDVGSNPGFQLSAGAVEEFHGLVQVGADPGVGCETGHDERGIANSATITPQGLCRFLCRFSRLEVIAPLASPCRRKIDACTRVVSWLERTSAKS